MSHAQGDVIRYKNDFWVVLDAMLGSRDMIGGKLRIIRPHVGNEKREILGSKAQPTGLRVVKINHKGKDVMVTRRGMIISMVSERLLKNTTPDGMAMLREAEAQGNALRMEYAPGPPQYNAHGVRIGRLINM